MLWKRTPLLLSILAVFVSCAENRATPDKRAVAAERPIENAADVPAKGDRMLGMGVNEGSIGFEKASSVARRAGLQVIELSQHWDDIEPRPHEYTNQWLDIANAYYPATGIKVVISFNPIDTNSLRVPADLRGIPFDDPTLINRYKSAVDYVLGRVKEIDLVGFAIGNEIDGTLGIDERKWAEYARFFKSTSEYVRQKRPGVPVGTKVMLPALIGSNAAQPAAVNAHADVLMATYYPLRGDFRVKDLSSVSRDIGKLVALPGDMPIFLAEVGCPSSESINSSQDKQSQFVREVFKAWDIHRSRLKLVNFIWLHDISPAEVKSYTKYYGVSTDGFAEYLGTLGLRTHDGKDKKAFRALRAEAALRGW